MPKNVVLLSDGTGTSAAQLLKTNVWRVYEALQLTDPTRQVACYDDGVGTSSFKPLALLGGAFGVGLARNVLRLYRFLCEHYEPGDRSYAFGFSRGAFTIRVLIGVICDQGIITTAEHLSPRPVGRGGRVEPPQDPREATWRGSGISRHRTRLVPHAANRIAPRPPRWDGQASTRSRLSFPAGRQPRRRAL